MSKQINKAKIMQYVWLGIGAVALLLMIIQIAGGLVKESIPMGIVCLFAIIFYFVRRKQAILYQKKA